LLIKDSLSAQQKPALRKKYESKVVMLLLVYFSMLIQLQKLYRIKLKGNILNWEDMEEDSRDIFGDITLQSLVEKGWFVEKKI
jgi:hypothetical protein